MIGCATRKAVRIGALFTSGLVVLASAGRATAADNPDLVVDQALGLPSKTLTKGRASAMDGYHDAKSVADMARKQFMLQEWNPWVRSIPEEQRATTSTKAFPKQRAKAYTFEQYPGYVAKVKMIEGLLSMVVERAPIGRRQGKTQYVIVPTVPGGITPDNTQIEEVIARTTIRSKKGTRRIAQHLLPLGKSALPSNRFLVTDHKPDNKPKRYDLSGVSGVMPLWRVDRAWRYNPKFRAD